MMTKKVFSFINIVGLTIGLTSFLLIALYIFDELTFDGFHKNSNSIYRVVDHKKSAEGTETKMAAAGWLVSQKAKTDLPQVKEAVRIAIFGRANVANIENTNVFYEDFTIANQAFLTVFDFKLLEGDRNTALAAPHSVIVTKETALKIFNTTSVIGKVIKSEDDSIPYTITAVLDNFPVNSHLAFNIVFSESSLASDDFKKFINSDWNSDAFITYFLLNDNADAQTVATKINQFVAANQGKDVKGKNSYVLQPLKDIHFNSDDIEGNSGKKGSITYIYVFSILGVFVLLIACINYMNITTAGFAGRSKEIAVRKVTGATRKNLAAQFLSEAFLVTGLALIFSLVLIRILLPSFNSFTEKQVTLGLDTDYRIWLGIGVIVAVAALLSGIYPAMFQSGFKPLALLKSKINISNGNLSLRRSLVVFQFAISIVMIVATMIIYQQMKYINTRDMGFNKEQLLVVDINSGKVRHGAETIKTEFSKIAQVQDVSVSSRVPGEWKDLPKVKVISEKVQTRGGDDIYFLGIDDNFLKTYKVNLISGRNFVAGSRADSLSVLINETAAKELGITVPAGQMIEIPSGEFNSSQPAYQVRVIGIVKDFNFQSLRQPIAPMLLAYQKNPIQSIDYFTARVTSNNMSETLARMDGILHSIDPKHLFEYHFLDKQWDIFYREDKIRETIFLLVAMLTIIIACLGLFGLATYAAEQRIKEIGVRKVLGASVSSIVTMLSKDFLKLVLIASVIAFPVAWWAMTQWLHDFAYHIDINWWVFVVAGFVALFIALITVSFQAIKAAIANPVKSLRTE